MPFGEEAMSLLETALGSFFGFIGALILFFLIEFFNKVKQEKSNEKGCIQGDITRGVCPQKC